MTIDIDPKSVRLFIGGKDYGDGYANDPVRRSTAEEQEAMRPRNNQWTATFKLQEIPGSWRRLRRVLKHQRRKPRNVYPRSARVHPNTVERARKLIEHSVTSLLKSTVKVPFRGIDFRQLVAFNYGVPVEDVTIDETGQYAVRMSGTINTVEIRGTLSA